MTDICDVCGEETGDLTCYSVPQWSTKPRNEDCGGGVLQVFDGLLCARCQEALAWAMDDIADDDMGLE